MRSVLKNAPKLCNSNDANSTFEILEGELRATLMRRDGSWPGFKTRAWPRCRWAAAGPGRTTSRRAEPRISDQAPLVRRAPEGPEDARGHGRGAGGRRRGLAGQRADAPSEARGADGERAGSRPRAHRAARPTGQNVQRRENPWRRKHRPNQSELLVVLRVLVGLAAARTPERADRRHLFRRQREGEDVEVLALTLRVTGLGQGQGAELVVPAQNEA